MSDEKGTGVVVGAAELQAPFWAGGGAGGVEDGAAGLWSAYGRMGNERLQLPVQQQSHRADMAQRDLPEARLSELPLPLWVPATTEGDVEQWRQLVSAYFPAHAVEGALRVIQCESNGHADAYNAGNIGLFQIHEPSHRARLRAGESLYTPEVNVRVASEIYADSAWIPWACKP